MTEIGTILDEVVGKIANAFNPEKVIIFGSYAYGRPRSGIPILAEAYTDETAAIDHAEELRTGANPEYNEVDVFTTQLK